MSDALLPVPGPQDDLGERGETELETEIDRDQGDSTGNEGDLAPSPTEEPETVLRTPTARDRLSAEGLAEDLDADGGSAS